MADYLRSYVLRPGDNLYGPRGATASQLLKQEQSEVGVDLTINNLVATTIAGPPGDVAPIIVSPQVSLASRYGVNYGVQVQIGAEATGYPIVVLSGAGFIIFYVGINGSIKSAKGIGLWGTTPPTTQPASGGSINGFTAGIGTPVTADSTFKGSGNTGDGYTIDDIVTALKLYGLLTA